MSRGVIQPSQQKLAEKLTILNDRGIGMLTRVYNIKKVRTHTQMYTHQPLKADWFHIDICTQNQCQYVNRSMNA